MSLFENRADEQLLDEQVMADIMGAAVPEAPQSTESDEVSAAPVEPVAPTAQPEAATPPAAEAKPETAPEAPKETPEESATRVVKHRGQEIAVPKEREDELIQKGLDYTIKTMELANYRKELDEVVTQVRGEQKAQAEAVLALLNDPDKLEAIARARRTALGQAPPPAAPSPEEELEYVSKSQVMQLVKDVESRVEARLKAETSKAQNAVKSDIELANMQSHFAQDFNSHVNVLLNDKFPLLKEFGDDDVADRIREDAARFVDSFIRLNPGVAVQPSQVKSVMEESARKRSEKIEGRLREREKRNAVRSQDLVEKGPEPKGGGAPPAPVTKKVTSLKDPALDQQVLQEIQSIMGRSAS